MRIRAALLSIILLLPLPMLAASNTTYSYTGSYFTIVEAPFTTSDRVTGYFTLPTLGANMTLTQMSVDSYSFSDGVNTYAGEYSLLGSVSTDAEGALDAWAIFLNRYGMPSCVIEGGSSAYAPQPADQCELNLGGPFGENREAGSWTMVTTEVPEPSSFVLLSTALLALAIVARKRITQGIL